MWLVPIPFTLVITNNRDHKVAIGETQLPIAPHPGAFAVHRKHHTHEGVDLYCPEGTEVCAVEDGTVVAVIPFTGMLATPPSPWWRDTTAVLVEGATGVVVYGEISSLVEVGEHVSRGQPLGHVKRVLLRDKGYPTTMLHLELHQHGTRNAFDWIDVKPLSLLDPTPYLLQAQSF